MTTIHRTKTQNNFTIIHNDIIKDENLSLPAIGLLVYLISKPNDWQVLPKYLSTKLYKKENSKASYRYILELLQELESSGHCTRSKNSDGSTTYYIYDTVQALNTEFGQPKPDVEKPHVEKPHVENPHTNKELIPYKENILKKEPNNLPLFSFTKESLLSQPLFATFDNWYKLYPKKVKKLRASKLFHKLPQKELKILIQATKLYIAYKQDNGEYFANPDTFLNQKVYLDFIDNIQQIQEETKQTDETHSIATILAKKISTNEGVEFSQLELDVISDSKATKEIASQLTALEFINFLKPYIKDRLC